MEGNWLFLRGFAREKRHWADFPEVFSTALNTPVHCIDLPGIGEFMDKKSPLTIPAITDFVRDEAQSRGLVGAPLRILSVSLGGMVTLEWLHKYPKDINLAVIMNTSINSLCPFYHRLRWQVWPQFLRALATPDIYKREEQVLELVSNHVEARKKMLPTWEQVSRSQIIPKETAVRQMLAASRYSRTKMHPHAPVLLLSSLGDRLVEPSCTEALHERFGWPIRQHPWAGHDISIDDPHWIIEQVRTAKEA